MWNLDLYKNDKFITECSCSNHTEGHRIVTLLSEEYDKIVEKISSYIFTIFPEFYHPYS